MKRNILRFAPWVVLMILGVVATPRMANTEPQERHPHIRASINELREARNELQRAAHDFCGHRVAALRDTDAALKQLQFALECDRQ
jgi:hypothetical protein